MTRPRLPKALRDYHGIPPRRRDELIAQAAGIAMRFSWAVKGRHAGEVARLTKGFGEQQWAALAIVLAEGVQPGSFRLKDVTEAARDVAAKGREVA